jgi:hypothetical protein
VRGLRSTRRHVGMFVSAKSQGIIGKDVVDWLVERDS